MRRAGMIRALGCAVTLAIPARAEEPERRGHSGDEPTATEAQASPRIAKPRLLSDPSLEYPTGGAGDAMVVLELLIDMRGAVSEVRVVEGEPPFADVAARAARDWSFLPARRNDKVVASRILFAVTFRSPDPDPDEKAPETPGAPEQSATERAAEEGPPKRERRARGASIEITVLGERPSRARTSFTRAEVRELPGAFGDPFRALESMPGVTPLATGIPFFFVRGAPPGNVGYFVDGIRVPLLYHLGLGPSVIHPGIVERVDLYPGGYPAEYGRFSGGIVAGETTAPRTDFHGEANVRLVDSGALAESGFAGDRGTALVGGRYSYTGLLLSLLVPEVLLQYWDYQARVTYALSETDSLGLFAFGSFDYLGEREKGDVDTIFGTQFHRLDLRYSHRWSSRTDAEVAITGGFDRTAAGDSDFATLDRMLAIRGRLRHRMSKAVNLRAGTNTTFDFLSLDLRSSGFDDEDEEEFAELFPSRTDTATGVFADLPWQATPRVKVTPGIRVDLYNSRGATRLGVDPRAAAEFELSDSIRIVHALGVAHQPPSFPVPIPGFVLTDLNAGLQRSLQSSAGLQLDLPSDYTATVTVFQNAFFNLTDFIGSGGAEDEDEDRDRAPPIPVPREPPETESDADRILERSVGRTIGLELMLRRPLTKHFGGFLAYTLSRSTRSRGRQKLAAAFDRTHVLNVAGAYDLGKRWRAGARAVFYTGRPIGFLTSSEEVDTRGRLPPFFRVDLRLEKRWRLGDRGYWAFVLEVLNASLSKEVVSAECKPDGCANDTIGPVTIPSIGLEAFF